MNKIKLTISTITCLLLVIFLVGCSKESKNDLDKYTRVDDTSLIQYYDDFDTLVNDVSDGTHYIYFGKPECPWCQQYLPYYVEYAELFNQKILYYNPEHVKGTYESLDEKGNIILYVNEEYQKIIDWIHQFDSDFSKGYTQYNLFVMDSKGSPHTKQWLYVPKLFKVVDGKIVGAVSTIEGHEKVKDSNGKFFLPELTAEQEIILKNELKRLFERKDG